MTKILALDPATLCGAAHSSGYCATWRLQANEHEHRGLRLVRLRQAILDVSTTLGVDLIAFENAAFGAGPRQKTTMAFHSQMMGAILLTAAELGVGFVDFKPTEIKRFATGSGTADKPQMIAAAESRLGIVAADDNVADALWVLELAKHWLAEQRKPKRKEEALWT